MADETPLMHQLGAFDPEIAFRLLPVLEQHGIAFELEDDPPGLGGSEALPGLQFGVNPTAAEVLVFVAERDLVKARELAHRAGSA